jgi:hypothetical protein
VEGERGCKGKFFPLPFSLWTVWFLLYLSLWVHTLVYCWHLRIKTSISISPQPRQMSRLWEPAFEPASHKYLRKSSASRWRTRAHLLPYIGGAQSTVVVKKKLLQYCAYCRIPTLLLPTRDRSSSLVVGLAAPGDTEGLGALLRSFGALFCFSSSAVKRHHHRHVEFDITVTVR